MPLAKTKECVLATLADDNHIEQAKQLFSSVYWNAGWDGDYLLLAHEVSDDKLSWFEEKGIQVYRCKSVDMKNPEDIFPVTVLSKMYLFKAYFKKWRKIIYLDADIIVTDSLDGMKEISGFGAKSDFETDLNHQVNLCYNYVISDPEWIERSKSRLSKKYDLKALSFNSGVMVIDTDIIQEDSFEELVDLWKKYRDIFYFGDQLVLNLYLYRKWHKIEDYYNALPLNNRMMKAFFDKGVVMPVLHFLGSDNKPWLKKSKFIRLWQSNLIRAETIDLQVIRAARFHSPEVLAWSRKMVTKNERPFIVATRHFFDFRELDLFYKRKQMKEFRHLLAEGIMRSYCRYYNRFIPYYFLSFLPQGFKDRIKFFLKKLNIGFVLPSE